MKVKEITHVYPYNISGFLNGKEGITIELEEGDDEDAAWEYAIQKCKEVALKVQKDFTQSVELVDRNPPLPVQQVEKPHVHEGCFKEKKEPWAIDKVEIVTLEDQIRSCTTLSVLGIYEKIIDKQKDAKEKTRLWLVYDEVYAQLTQTETVAT